MVKRDEPLRVDETHKRLLEWGYGQPPSERLAALVLDDEGYKDIDPSHPLGGRDGGRDGHCTRDGEEGVWAVYFPRNQQSLKDIESKLTEDIEAARKHNPEFLVFVTNQELRLSERRALRALGGDIRIELLHLERVASILDRPRMAPVREQFLRISATPVEQPADDVALSIMASVIGTAHMFTDDSEVLERWVQIRESEIRKKSDEGRARVRAEQEKKARAEAERQAREAWDAAQKAVDSIIPKRPWESGFEIPRTSDFEQTSAIYDSLVKQVSVPDFAARLAGIPGVGEQPKPPEPLSGEQIAAKVNAYKAGLEARWPSCRDYLASVGFAAVHFRIRNEAKNFLNDVEVVLTFLGARGIDFEGLDDFELMKVQDPTWVRSSHNSLYQIAIPPMPLVRPRDFPITLRHNDDGDLEVRIALAHLRPLSEWRSEEFGDEVVIVVDPGATVDEVTVNYTATAQGHDAVFEGASFSVPVEKVEMLDKLIEVMDATKEKSTF